MIFYLGITGFIISVSLIFFGMGENLNIDRYVLKTDVVKAMSGDWNIQTFNCSGQILTDYKDKDVTTFYNSKDIDSRIEKLNKVLSK